MIDRYFVLRGGVVKIRFYYENYCGASGHFTLKKTEIPRAIMSAWNIEANLRKGWKISREMQINIFSR